MLMNSLKFTSQIIYEICIFNILIITIIYKMIIDLFNISVAGLIAGIVFSMPVAGPISILITSNALGGRLRFCKRAAIGAAIVEFIYVFIVIIGIKSLFSYYQPFIPYLILVGSFFLVAVAYKITTTKINLNEIEKTEKRKDANRGGLRAGLILNLTNPSLFVGWLASSFLVFSLMTQMGIGTGGLDMVINDNINSISEIAGDQFNELSEIETKKIPVEKPQEISPVALAMAYSAMVGFGGFLWLFFFAKLLVTYRYKLSISLINKVIQTLGIIMFVIAGFLLYKSVLMLI